MRKILITGANSYVGTSFEKWLESWSGEYQVDTLDMIDPSWKNKSFAGYDTVFHVAGIAHADIGKVDDNVKKKYYDVNCTLAVDTAKKAKAEGVKQFIFMSSMIIYGDSAGIGSKETVTRTTEPSPANFYGDSKWQADKLIRELDDNSFKTVVLRPPMIYGKGSKGNYQTLSKIARKVPIFPDMNNQRSILYISNLCELVRLIIEHEDSGIYFPQNREYVKTSDLVRLIAEAHGKKVILTKFFKPFIIIAGSLPGTIGKKLHKAFGNSSYDMDISHYYNDSYKVKNLKDSIIETER